MCSPPLFEKAVRKALGIIGTRLVSDFPNLKGNIRNPPALYDEIAALYTFLLQLEQLPQAASRNYNLANVNTTLIPKKKIIMCLMWAT
jgi:hypothetical protein